MVGQLLWGLVAFRHGRAFSYLRGKIEGLRTALPKQAQTQSQDRLRTVLEESERHILELQQQTGFDEYWRSYFWLLRR